MSQTSSRIDVWRILRVTAIVSLVLWYAILWAQKNLISSSPSGADFIHFYTAGQIAQTYGFSSVYNLDIQQEIENGIVGRQIPEEQFLPYNHIPYLVPFLWALFNNSYVESFVRWAILLLAIFVIGNVIFINSIFPNRSNLERLTLLGGAIIFYPFFISLLMGQDSVILYLGVALWSVGLLKKNDWLAGIGMALITVRPHIFLVLSLSMLVYFYKNWRRFFAPTFALVIISFLLLGVDGAREFINILLLTAGGRGLGANQAVMFNMLGLLLRIFPSASEQVIRSITWAGYAVAIIGLCVIWWRFKTADEHLIGFSLLATLFFAPHLHYHDLTSLIIPLLLLTKVNISKGFFSQPSNLVICVSVALFVSASVLQVYFILPYILYAMLAGFFWQQGIKVKMPKLFNTA